MSRKRGERAPGQCILSASAAARWRASPPRSAATSWASFDSGAFSAAARIAGRGSSQNSRPPRCGRPIHPQVSEFHLPRRRSMVNAAIDHEPPTHAAAHVGIKDRAQTFARAANRLAERGEIAVIFHEEPAGPSARATIRQRENPTSPRCDTSARCAPSANPPGHRNRPDGCGFPLRNEFRHRLRDLRANASAPRSRSTKKRRGPRSARRRCRRKVATWCHRSRWRGNWNSSLKGGSRDGDRRIEGWGMRMGSAGRRRITPAEPASRTRPIIQRPDRIRGTDNHFRGMYSAGAGSGALGSAALAERPASPRPAAITQHRAARREDIVGGGNGWIRF